MAGLSQYRLWGVIWIILMSLFSLQLYFSDWPKLVISKNCNALATHKDEWQFVYNLSTIWWQFVYNLSQFFLGFVWVLSQQKQNKIKTNYKLYTKIRQNKDKWQIVYKLSTICRLSLFCFVFVVTKFRQNQEKIRTNWRQIVDKL